LIATLGVALTAFAWYLSAAYGVSASAMSIFSAAYLAAAVLMLQRRDDTLRRPLGALKRIAKVWFACYAAGFAVAMLAGLAAMPFLGYRLLDAQAFSLVMGVSAFLSYPFVATRLR
jgi:hypothetical protein